MSDIQVLSIYLPQFHPIPENDAAWGTGFTEWTNVARARPLFRGHRQPQLPADLGFYDLRLSQARLAQAALARRYGISGFCYYHYWFNGQRLLDQPFTEVLASGEPDFPFCLFWANETWSRRWLGEERDIILRQTYSPEDDEKHGRFLATAFADPRYVRVGDRPLFLIYRPLDLPDPRRTVEAIKEASLRSGLSEPYIVGSNAHAPELDARTLGFDANLNFEPQLSVLPEFTVDGWTRGKLRRNLALGIPSAQLKIYDYGHAKDLMESRDLGYPAYPCPFVGWDNTPRRNDKAIVVTGQSPDRFEQSLLRARAIVESGELDAKLVFINAWNEWAEGNHLEPDMEQGYTYLERVAAVFDPKDGSGSPLNPAKTNRSAT